MRKPRIGSRPARRSPAPPLLELLEDRTLLNGAPAGPQAVALDAAFAADRILVRFRPEASVAGKAALPGSQLGASAGLVPGLREVTLAPGVSVADAVAAYQADPSVLYAHPDYRVHVALVPNDPRFNSLWGMNNVGQTGGTADADIDAVEAWDRTTGNGSTVVAVIDTGVDYTHPDLAANIWTNTPEANGAAGVDDDGNGYVDDVHGYDFANNDGDPMDDHFHGTHVAGTIGAVGNNGVGVAGVSWDVQIMALKFLDANGSGFLSDAIRAIDYAAAMGATVSNNSWGGGGFEQALKDAISNAASRGHIFVAAAGNDGTNNDVFPAYPASYDLDNIIAVAATDHNDNLAGFSNYGAAAVDLGAPGVDIHSTLPTRVTDAMQQYGLSANYGTISGTSMATPHVTGVVALVHDLHPTWSYTQIINQVLATVDPVSALATTTATGGRLNAAAAIGNPLPDSTGPRVTAATPTGTTVGPVERVTLTFSEAVTGFAADDAAFTGPSGPIAVTVAEVAGSGGKRFDVAFTPQDELGDYTLTVRPDIFDLAGNPLDQDRNGIGGQLGDVYTTTFTLSGALVVESADVPAPLPPFSILISELVVSQDVTIGDLNVQLDITHGVVGNLYISLISPAGTEVILSYFNGGSGNNFADTIFDDEAALPISSGAAPFAGSYQPDMPLSDLDGENARGTWWLWVESWDFYESGTLNSWSVIIQPSGGGPPPPPPPPPPPVNSPPIPADDWADTLEDTAVTVRVLDNDTDPDGDSLRVTALDSVWGGTAVINADNTIAFTPDPNFNSYWNGDASFGYTVEDGRGGSSWAWVTIHVEPVNDAPTAVNDQAAGYTDVPLTFSWTTADPPLDANDYDVDGDFVWLSAVGNATHGTAVLAPDGSVTFTPELDYIGTATFEYTLTDGALTSVGRVTITLTKVVYLSTAEPGTVTGTDGVRVAFDDSDILQLTVSPGGTYGYRLYFDASDVGLTTNNEDVDAFTVLWDGSILISTVGAFSVPRLGGGSITGSGEDLLIFYPNRVGSSTAGWWDLYFDGSDVGLSGTAENIDGVAALSDGRILISTTGNVSVPGVSGADTDLLAFTPWLLGTDTDGWWELYFDGSDVGLSNSTAEDIDTVAVREAPLGLPTLYFSTLGNFAVPGRSGANEDVLAFNPTNLGSTTSGTYRSTLVLDGSTYGLAAFNVDGFAFAPVPPVGGAANTVPHTSRGFGARSLLAPGVAVFTSGRQGAAEGTGRWGEQPVQERGRSSTRARAAATEPESPPAATSPSAGRHGDSARSGGLLAQSPLTDVVSALFAAQEKDRRDREASLPSGLDAVLEIDDAGGGWMGRRGAGRRGGRA